MFRTVHAKQQKCVLARKRQHLAAADRRRLAPFAKLAEIQAPWKIPQRKFRMQFDHRFRFFAVSVLAGNLSAALRAFAAPYQIRYHGAKAQANERIVRRRDLTLRNHDVEIGKLSQRHVAICLCRQNGPLIGSCAHTMAFERLQQTKQFGS